MWQIEEIELLFLLDMCCDLERTIEQDREIQVLLDPVILADISATG